MKKYLAVFFLVSIIWLVGGPLKVFAEETSVVSEQINARILPLVWYSTLSVNEGDSIRIYAGIQNNSGIDFKGTATFYIDDKDTASNPFNSSNDSLNAVSIDWTAEVGSHDIQVKIVTSLPSDKTLISYESAKSNISVTKKIVKDVVKNTIINTISNVKSKIDEVVVPLVNKIEDLKKPVSIAKSIINQGANDYNANDYNASQENDGVVLGASTDPASNSGTNNISKIDSIFNIAMDVLVFLVKNWLWTLGGIIAVFLIIIFKMRKKK